MRIVIESHFRIVSEDDQERINVSIDNLLRRYKIRVRKIEWQDGKRN